MARWEGFSEEDIKKVSSCERLVEAQPYPPITVRVAKRQTNIAHYPGQKNVARSRMLQKAHNSVEPNISAEKMPKEAFLSKPTESVPADGEAKSSGDVQSSMIEVSSDSGCGISNSTGSPSVTSNTTTPNTSPNHGTVCLRIKEGKSYEVLSAERSANNLCTLDEFQSRQKLMEEQNRQRKELLAKALADRKRYNKAEKEFLDAKLLLFDKLERKELLTEHLCTIIEQNEIRKARKLSELMDKLQLGTTTTDVSEEDHKNVTGNVILSPLCALDEVTYSVCNTLKHRNKPDSVVTSKAIAGNNDAQSLQLSPSEHSSSEKENLIENEADQEEKTSDSFISSKEKLQN